MGLAGSQHNIDTERGALIAHVCNFLGPVRGVGGPAPSMMQSSVQGNFLFRHYFQAR